MFGKSGCKCHRCVARRRIRFVLGLGLVALLPVGYLALPDSRKNVADLLPANLAHPALSESTPINSALAGGKNVTDLSPADVAHPALSESTPTNSVQSGGENVTDVSPPDVAHPTLSESTPTNSVQSGGENVTDVSPPDVAHPALSESTPINSVRAPDSAAEPMAAADGDNPPVENRSETVSQKERQPVNEPEQAPSSNATPDEVHRTTLLAGALTQTDKPVETPQEVGATSEMSKDPLNLPEKSAAMPPVAVEHQSVVVAGVQPWPGNANPAAISSPDLSAYPVPQDSNPAAALSPAKPNPSPGNSAPSSDHSNPRAPGANGALAGLVASQSNYAAEVPSPSPQQEPNELHGYIAFAAKNEQAASPPAARRTAKVPGHRVTADETPPAPRAGAPKAEDIPTAPAKPVYRSLPGQSGQLESFASDFVRTEGSGNIAGERRFYADSVHFHNEGDLSWAGVAAATRRYHQGKQNRQFQAAGPATVKGPVDGGFYVVDQPVSWRRVEGSSLVRGRSLLRMRVLPTGANLKITSIEEVGQ
jgi:hypothetical protein